MPLTQAERRCLKSLAERGAYAYRKPRGSQYAIIGSTGKELHKVTGETLWGLVRDGYAVPIEEQARKHVKSTEIEITEKGIGAINPRI